MAFKYRMIMILILYRLMSKEAIDVSVMDTIVIGAGPQALTWVAHLLAKRSKCRDRIRLIDPSGGWLDQWQRQFTAYEIPHLRSPASHHPVPDYFALRGFAERRSEEFHLPYDLPGTQLFQDFCQNTIRQLKVEDHVISGRVSEINLVPDGFELILSDGREIRAKRVVYAGGGGHPNLPSWMGNVQSNYPGDRLKHASQVNLAQENVRSGERILIVGSGLTSGHLAIGAAARGATVKLMARRNYYEKPFDSEPGWFKPKYLKDFWEQAWEVRAKIVREARNGGSLTPAVLTKLRKFKAERKVEFYENCQVQNLTWNSEWTVQCDNSDVLQCDRIWVATGSQLDIEQSSLFSNVLKQCPIEVVDGLPVLTENLRWKDRELYLMGGFAGLQVGPTARNLSGARMASERIVSALIARH